MIGSHVFIAGFFLCVTSARIGVEAEKVDKQHRDSHHEKDYFHQRVKRYSGPYSLNNLIDDDDLYAMEKRYRSASMGGNPAASHFRELQSRQRKRPSPSLEETSISPSQIQSYRNLMLYSGRHPIDEGDIDLGTQDDQIVPEVSSSSGSIGPLSDDDLQALLILLEQYKLQGKSPSGRNFYTPPAQYFTPTMDMASPRKRETGKRETGKRTAKVKGALMMEQPMSFENSLGGDTYPVFLSQKRSKRVGHVPMQMKPLTRFKKQTGPGTDSDLNKFFAAASIKGEQAENHASKHSTLTPTTVISSMNQLPAPSNIKEKKSIDWSNYFGIDKRSNNEKHVEKDTATSDVKDKIPSEDPHEPHSHLQNEKVISSTTSMPTSTITSTNGASRDTRTKSDVTDKALEKNQESENAKKAESDKQWILKEFYKTLAMSTNVKRKRETPANEDGNNIAKLEKMEKKMAEAGDKIIWDTLKYTGAHKDEKLSPSQLAQVKNQIIGKLAAAYSLEKVREAIEDFRQQLKDKQQYY